MLEVTGRVAPSLLLSLWKSSIEGLSNGRLSCCSLHNCNTKKTNIFHFKCTHFHNIFILFVTFRSLFCFLFYVSGKVQFYFEVLVSSSCHVLVSCPFCLPDG